MKRKATVSRLKKLSKKKVTAILFFIALLIAMFPDVQSDTLDGNKPSPDYGIYNALEEIQDEKNSRINSPEILNVTQGRFDNMTIISGEEKVDLESRREIVSPNIPVPEMLDIYDAMMRWDNSHYNEIVDWLLPPDGALRYHIYSKYITNDTIIERWTNASFRPTLIIPETNIDRWWGVDVDDDGGDDIEVFFGPILDLGWEPGQVIQRISQLFLDRTLELDVTFETNIHKLPATTAFSAPDFKYLEVFVAKAMSYTDHNFIFFYGMNFSNVVTYFNDSMKIESVQLEAPNILETVTQAIAQGYLSIDFADLVGLQSPYVAQWDSGNEPLSTLGIKIATARLEFLPNDTYEFLNRSWVDVAFKDTAPITGEMYLEADDMLSSFDQIKWTASNVCDIHIKFFDSQENLTYLEMEIEDLPYRIDTHMYVEEINGKNFTTVEYDASSAMKYVVIHSYEYFDTSYEDITRENIDSGKIEYIHLFMNITNLPRRLYIKGLFYLEEIDDSLAITPGLELIGQLVDSIAYRLISRFTRISKTLSSMPYRMLSMAEDGSIALFDTYEAGPIGEVEFIFTSGDYATTEGNYIAFYNNTRPSKYPIAQISMSGRMSDISYFNSSFVDDVFAEVRMMNNQEFRAIYADDINSLNAEVIVSNMPGTIIIYETPNLFSYDGVGRTIDEVRFLSDYQGGYLDFRILDLASQIYMEYNDTREHIYTGSTQDSIGEIEFLFTTGPIYRMEGNYLLLRQESDFSVLSGRIKDISSIDYSSGENGRLEVDFTQENPMNITLFDNRTEILGVDLIIDPLPKFISVNLSSFLSSGFSNIPLPQLKNTGIMGFVSIIFGVATMGNDIMAMIDETTQNALDNIGNVIENLSFSYYSDTHITIIGRILRGETFTLDDVDWMHGISAKQQVNAQGTSMVAKLYFSGLPTASRISTRIQGDDIFLDLHITDYRPKHDWLCIDVRGVQDRDVMFYLNDIRQGMDLDLSVDLLAQINTIPQRVIGSVHMDSSKAIGALYGRMRQTTPEIAISEFFLSSLPKTLDTDFNLSGNISIVFHGRTGIEHMFVKNTRTRNDEFHDIYAILHELPDELEVSILPITDYDMDASPLHTLPSLSISSSGGTLDAYLFIDGKGIGQVGVAAVQVVNAPMSLSGEFSEGKYRFKSTGVDYFWMHVMELPIMEGHKTKSIEIVGKDVKSFDVTFDTLFGNYPMIGMENTKGGELQFVFDHEMDGSKAGIAFIDFKTTNGLPSPPSILINGGSINLDKGSSHMMVPAPILSIWLTIFS
ncbi:MAG: hypothetical protein V3U20_03200 [Thermoplasmata archaeon]